MWWKKKPGSGEPEKLISVGKFHTEGRNWLNTFTYSHSHTCHGRYLKHQLTAWTLMLLVQPTCTVYKVVFFKLFKNICSKHQSWKQTVWRSSLKVSDIMSCNLFIFKFRRIAKVAIQFFLWFLPAGLSPPHPNSRWDQSKCTLANKGSDSHSKIYFLSEKLLLLKNTVWNVLGYLT